MKRREFITLVGGVGVAAMGWPLPVSGQRLDRIWRLGYIASVGEEGHARLPHLRRGLAELGYTEGRNLAMFTRFAGDQYTHFENIAAELIDLKVDAIVTVTLPAALAAQKVTATVPIIFLLVSDPVGAKLVASIRRPGGNITGVSANLQSMVGKRLELFKETVGFSRVGLLINPSDPLSARTLVQDMEASAPSIRVSIRSFEARSPAEIEPAILALAGAELTAAYVVGDAMFYRERVRIAELAARHRIATCFTFRDHVVSGGLMSYGTNLDTTVHRAAAYLDKVFRGEKPGDLPVEQPTKFELVINLKTAKALGLTVPPMLLARADEVIE